jgi:hypothetical protein
MRLMLLLLLLLFPAVYDTSRSMLLAPAGMTN